MNAAPALNDDRPEFRVAVFGLAGRFRRLLEIVLRHARHNPYRYCLAGPGGPARFDVALIDMTATGAPNLFENLVRIVDRDSLVRVGRRCDPSRQQDDLLVHSFVVQVLCTLNRVVERKLSRVPAPGAPGLGGLPSAQRMPRSDIAGETPAALPPPAAPPDLTCRPRVLAVDDSPTVRRQLGSVLHQWGIDCDAVGSASNAVARLASARYELVLADVAMPDLNGYRLTRLIRKDEALRGLPVVLLGNRASAIDLARGALAGCSGYLVKPVTMQSLRLLVTRHLRRARLSP